MKQFLLLAFFLVGGCGSGNSNVPPPPLPPSVCDHTLRWTNPTEDVDGFPLEAGELTKLTISAGMIPMAPTEELVFTMDIDAYILMWVIKDQPAGLWYYRATVSNEWGESDFSNETTRSCP